MAVGDQDCQLAEVRGDEDLDPGTLARENTEQLVLRDATDKEIAIPKSNIKSRVLGNNSLMPSGLVDSLPAAQQLDLFRFLQTAVGDKFPGFLAQGAVWFLQIFRHLDERFFLAAKLHGQRAA